MSRTPFDPLWDYSALEKTENQFREFLPAFENNLDLHAQLLTQIARTYSLRARFEEAHEVLDEVEEMRPGAASIGYVRYLLERGRTYNSAGNPLKARPYFLEAFSIAEEINALYYAVDAAHMMGIVEPPEGQISWTRRAILLAENAQDEETRAWLGPLYNNLGWSYHDTGDFEAALQLFQTSLAWRQENNPGSREEQIARWTVGRTLRSLQRYEEAFDLQSDLHRQLEAVGEADGYVLEELGELSLALDRPAEAAPFFGKAFSLLSQDLWLTRHEPARLERLHRLGRLSP